MASYKNQHFVPRCYFKPFSVNRGGFAISVFNLDRSMGIESASIRGQCARSYFYGKDLSLEKLLQFSEDTYANTIMDIDEPGYALTPADASVIRHFAYLQHYRTEATAKRAAISMSEVADMAWNGEAPADWRTTTQDALHMGMRAFADTMHIIDDLKVCLVRNVTTRPFITSDNPAVMTNRWYAQNPKAKGLSGGAGSAGALVFLPLTPSILALIYDGGVYSITNSGGWTTVYKSSCAEAFNEHQFLNCSANVYFSDWRSLDQISKSFEAARPYRPTVRHEIIPAVRERSDDWGEHYRVLAREELGETKIDFLHLRTIQPRPRCWPSIIKFRVNPKVYYNGTATGYLRRATAEENSYIGPPYRRVT